MTTPRLLLLVLLPALLLSACDSGKNEASGKKGSRGPVATPVRTATAARGAIEDRAEYVADTRPRAEVALAAKITGRVSEIAVDLGERVHKDQVLVRIDDRELRHALQEANAAFATAEASLRRADVDLARAERDRARKAPLLERGGATQAEMETLASVAEAARAARDLAQAQRAQATARIERARIDLDNTRIAAPFDGAVADRKIHPGALVSPGTELLRVSDVQELVVRFGAPEADVVRVAPDQEIEVRFDALPGGVFRGRVARISPVVDPKTRMIPIEAELTAEGGLKPGMFARVSLVLDRREDALLVPASALLRRQVESEEVVQGVYVVKDGKATFRPIQVGLRSRELVEVVSGLEEGEAVVVAGHSELKDGDAVRVLGAGAATPERGAR